MRSPARRPTLVALGLSLGLLLAACTSDPATVELPPPPPSVAPLPSTTSTTRVDLSRIELARVPGNTTTTLRTAPGTAVLQGIVRDGSGLPVEGAIVRATWYGGPTPTVVEALTGPGGTYRLEQLQGGRWRVRAFVPGRLATVDIPAFFLGAVETRGQDLRVEALSDLSVTARMAPDPYVGDEVELAVLVLRRTIDDDGRATAVRVPDTTLLLTGSGWAIPPEPRVTGADGVARWPLRCLVEGAESLTVTVGSRPFPISVPACGNPESTTTTTRPATTSTTKPTTTTGPGGAGATTTTRPRTTTTTRPGATTTTRPRTTTTTRPG